MVYHHPSDQPWSNTAPAVRLLLSDAASAKFARRGPTLVISTALSCAGAAVLLKAAPWPNAAEKIITRLTSPQSVVTVTGALLTANVFLTLSRKWFTHFESASTSLRNNAHSAADVTNSNAEQWLSSQKMSAHMMEFGAISPQPFFSTSQVKKMTLASFLTMEFTVGVEASVTAWARIVRHSFAGALGWHESISAVSRRRLYQVVLNTSLLNSVQTHSMIDSDLNVELGGHVVVENVRLPFGDNDHRTFRKIVVFVNHTTLQLERVVCVFDHKDEVTTAVGEAALVEHVDEEFVAITTWGSRVHAENTDAACITAEESLHQAGLILAAIVTCSTPKSSGDTEHIDARHHQQNRQMPGDIRYQESAAAMLALPVGCWWEATESAELSQWTAATKLDAATSNDTSVIDRAAALLQMASSLFTRGATSSAPSLSQANTPPATRRSSLLPDTTVGNHSRARRGALTAVSFGELELFPHQGRAFHSGSVLGASSASPRRVSRRESCPPTVPMTRNTSPLISLVDIEKDNDVVVKENDTATLIAQHMMTVDVLNDSGDAEEVPLMAELQRRSTTCQMTAAAMDALRGTMCSNAVSNAEVRAIVAATVGHSLEHYMLGELAPVWSDHSQCIVLRTDLSEVFHRHVYPFKFSLRPTLSCGKRSGDFVAAVIYSACVQREQELVEESAAAMTQRKPSFVPLKDYCADYLHIGCSV